MRETNICVGENGEIEVEVKDVQAVDNEEISEEIDRRRNTRITSVLALLALMVSMTIVSFKFTYAAIDGWPIEGKIYYIYSYFIFIAVTSALIVTIGNVVWFILVDLKRYSISENGYSYYDGKSDKAYEGLIKNVTVAIYVLVIAWCGIIPAMATINEGYKAIGLWIYTAIFALFGICLLIKYFKRVCEIFIQTYQFLLTWIVVCGLVLFVILILHANTSKCIKIDYSSEGKTNISYSGPLDDMTLTERVCNEKGEVVYEVIKQRNQLLCAGEGLETKVRTEDGRKKARSAIFNGEKGYWNYSLDLEGIDLKAGIYRLEIYIEHEDRTVDVLNMFEKREGIYYYGVDSITKEY